MGKENNLDGEALKVANLIADAMSEHLNEVVVPAAKKYVESFELELNKFNWADDEKRLEIVGTEFVKKYNNLEQQLFDEFDKKVFARVFSKTSKNGEIFRNELKQKIRNYLDNIAAEALEKIITHSKK